MLSTFSELRLNFILTFSIFIANDFFAIITSNYADACRRVCAVDCKVTEDSMTPDAPVPVVLNRK